MMKTKATPNLFLILNTVVSVITLTTCVSLKPQTSILLKNTQFYFGEDTTNCSNKSFKETFGGVGLIRERLKDGKPYIPVENMYKLLSYADSTVYFKLNDSIYSINIFSEQTKLSTAHKIKEITAPSTSRTISSGNNGITITDTITGSITNFHLPEDTDEFFGLKTPLLSKMDANIIFYCREEAGIYRYNIKLKENKLIAESCRHRNFVRIILSENEEQIIAETRQFNFLYGDTSTFIYLIDSINTKPIIKLLLKQ